MSFACIKLVAMRPRDVKWLQNAMFPSLFRGVHNLTTTADKFGVLRFDPGTATEVVGDARHRGAAAERVLHEDNHMLVVFKPAGLLSQSSHAGDENLLDIYKEYIAHKYNKPGAAFMGLIHRLDVRTSGLIVLARTSKAASRLTGYFSNRSVDKRYLCVVHGRLNGDGRCVNWLVPGNAVSSTSIVASADVPGAVAAELIYKPLCIIEKAIDVGPQSNSDDNSIYTLVDVILKTGDTLYGGKAMRNGPNMLLALHNYCLGIPSIKRDIAPADIPDKITHLFLCNLPPQWRDMQIGLAVTDVSSSLGDVSKRQRTLVGISKRWISDTLGRL